MLNNIQPLNVDDEYLTQNKKSFEDNYKTIKERKKYKKNYYELRNRLENVRDKFSYKIMVPLPENVPNGMPLGFIEGIAVHTNEIFMPIGSKYYTKGTVNDGLELCMRRAREIKQGIRDLEREQRMLLERIAFLQLSTEERGQVEIMEAFNEEEDKEWREKHGEHVRKMKQDEAIERQKQNSEPTDSYLARLDELEKEELMGNKKI